LISPLPLPSRHCHTTPSPLLITYIPYLPPTLPPSQATARLRAAFDSLTCACSTRLFEVSCLVLGACEAAPANQKRRRSLPYRTASFNNRHRTNTTTTTQTRNNTTHRTYLDAIHTHRTTCSQQLQRTPSRVSSYPNKAKRSIRTLQHRIRHPQTSTTCRLQHQSFESRATVATRDRLHCKENSVFEQHKHGSAAAARPADWAPGSGRASPAHCPPPQSVRNDALDECVQPNLMAELCLGAYLDLYHRLTIPHSGAIGTRPADRDAATATAADRRHPPAVC